MSMISMKQIMALVLYGIVVSVALVAIREKASRVYAASKPFLMRLPPAAPNWLPSAIPFRR